MYEGKVIAVIAVCLTVVILCFPVYYTFKNRQIAEMVKSGASPLEAACAFEGDRTQLNNCTVLYRGK